MKTRLENDKTYQPALINRALLALERYEQGEVRAKELIHHKLTGQLYKIDLGLHFRMLSKDLIVWYIVSHEHYTSKLLK